MNWPPIGTILAVLIAFFVAVLGTVNAVFKKIPKSDAVFDWIHVFGQYFLCDCFYRAGSNCIQYVWFNLIVSTARLGLYIYVLSVSAEKRKQLADKTGPFVEIIHKLND